MLRRSLVVLGSVFAVTFLGVLVQPSQAHAQQCFGPAQPGTKVLRPQWVTVYPNVWNLLEVPAFSPYSVKANTGFIQLCDDLNLPAGAQILQIDAQAGQGNSHICGTMQVFPVTPCQGIAIFSPVQSIGLMKIGLGTGYSGVEGTWPYTTYGAGIGAVGTHIFGIPLTIQSLSPEDLCDDLQLPAGSRVIRIDAATGSWWSHICGTTPVWNLVPGEGVILEVPGFPGAPVATGQVLIY